MDLPTILCLFFIWKPVFKNHIFYQMEKLKGVIWTPVKAVSLSFFPFDSFIDGAVTFSLHLAFSSFLVPVCSPEGFSSLQAGLPILSDKLGNYENSDPNATEKLGHTSKCGHTSLLIFLGLSWAATEVVKLRSHWNPTLRISPCYILCRIISPLAGVPQTPGIASL